MAMYEQDRFIAGDCREVLPMLARQRRRFQTCVTSPPYFRLRDYGGQQGQIGLEPVLPTMWPHWLKYSTKSARC